MELRDELHRLDLILMYFLGWVPFADVDLKVLKMVLGETDQKS